MSPSQKEAIEAAPKDPPYIVRLKRGTAKGLLGAPEIVHDLIDDLREELALEGPVQPEWPGYRKLDGLKGQPKDLAVYHCHIKRGNPTWVCVWEVQGKSIEIEITYTGTHEKAPYNKKRYR